jgi:hypothetical protein
LPWWRGLACSSIQATNLRQRGSLQSILRGFDDTLADPAFIGDAAHVHLTIDPMEPDEIARWLDRADAVPKEQAARAGKFSGVQ